MAALDPCPEINRLRSLLAGDAEPSLLQHLEQCERCQETVETLAADKNDWAAALRYAPQPAEPVEPPLRKILDQCGMDPTSAQAEPSSEVDLPAGFLQPSDNPAHLGRLGSYEVQEVAARGGMGIVLKAFDQTLHRVVAIKVLAPQLASNSIARMRFLREARAAAAVRDEHVVHIYAVGEEKGIPYLVMEFISGISLQQKIDRSAPLSSREVLRIGHQTAHGLAVAHAQGLVHRDIKPSNILLENGIERVKITDFGLVRVADDGDLTQSGIVAGTPQYMAPEQARGEAVDYRADLFSLGSVLYAMCTGVPPFRASGNMAILKRVCDDTPRAVRELNPDVPASLAAIIDKLNAKDPAARFQTAKEVANLLGGYLAHLQGPVQAPMPTLLYGNSIAKRRTWRPWIAASVAIVGLVLAGYLLGPKFARMVSGKGILTFATDDPHATVVVRSTQKPELPVTVNLRDNLNCDLDAGDYELELVNSRADLQLSPTTVTLARGQSQVVEVREKPDFVGEVRRFVGHTQQVRNVAVSSDGLRMLTGGADTIMRLWDVASGKLLRTFQAPSGIHQVVFSPDERTAVSCGHKGICLWDLGTGTQLRVFGRPEEVCSFVFLPDGKQAITGSGKVLSPAHSTGYLRLWNVTNGTEIPRFEEQPHYVWSVALTKDGKYAVSGCWDETVRLWNVATGEELKRFDGHTDYILAVAFTPDGRYILSAGRDNVIRMWDRNTGKEVRQFLGHEHNIECLAVSPDGRRVISGGLDNTIRLWDVNSGREMHRFTPGLVFGLTFSPDGCHVVSAGDDATVRLWRVPASRP
ncbi:MAG: protein kinase domain-containing protein [Gemmataceae bacterium]